MMIKHYKEMQIVFSMSNYEAIYNALYLNGIENILEEDGLVKICFSDSESNELYKLRKFLIYNVGLKEKDILIKDFNDKNWNAEWEKSIEPVYIRDKIVIYPSWKKHNVKDFNRKVNIEINPKMSFGTGHNETTQLILEMLCDYIDVKDNYMLDFGCGTGILSIAGIKLGVKSVIAIDIDADAIENAKEYFETNEVTKSIKLYKKSITEINEMGFDVICVNIISSVIAENLKTILNKLKPSGKLFISGVLDEEDSSVSHTIVKGGFHIKDKRTKSEWLGIYAIKK